MTARREHVDVDYWGRLARQVRAAQRPAAEQCPAPRPSPSPYERPTYDDHRGWDLALARPCARHGAEPGAPCWDSAISALCGTRAGTTGPVPASRRKTTKEAA